ncbi:MAG TPA: hypothetical protein VKV40_03810 [Ktedonobacteraceae bacterium]|nr:hypothetical protein [Ktedonobacteraceae bacterium]
MSSTAAPLADIKEEALRVIDAANAEGFPLRLLGGLAIYLQCPGTQTQESLQRTYKDLDFVTLAKWSGKTKALFTSLGYTGNKTFNALHGHQRLLFWDEEHGRQVDIFLDRMQMCHTLDFRSRLTIEPYTLPIADLLLTKLQIVEINHKDIIDAIAVFYDHDITGDDHSIHAGYISELAAGDWGLYKTLQINLQKIRAYALEHGFPPYVVERIDRLVATIETRPKSLSWKARAIVGERVRWYELPEEHA